MSTVRQRLIDGTITIEELLQRGNAKFERNNFQGAIKLYTLAIDKIQQDASETFLTSGLKLAKLIMGRAKCNYKIAQIRQSKEHYELSLKDTDFILKSKNFDIEGMKVVNSDFYQQIITLNDQARMLAQNVNMADVTEVTFTNILKSLGFNFRNY